MLSNIGLSGLLLIAVVVLVLFGRGRVSGLMGEIGQGIRAFRTNLAAGDAHGTPATSDSPATGDSPATAASVTPPKA